MTNPLYKLGLIKSMLVVGLSLFHQIGNAAPIMFSGFDMNTNGDAYLDGSDIVLTDAEILEVGSVFTDQAVSIGGNTSFSTKYTFSISTENAINYAADGLVFVMHNDPAGSNALGGTGGGKGYTGITNSVAVALDIYAPDNDLQLLTNGSGMPLTNAAVPFETVNTLNEVSLWIEYDGITDLLEVYINSGLTQPSSPLLSYIVDIDSILGGQAYMGFTSATGNPDVHSAEHRITSWTFEVNEAGDIPEPGVIALLAIGVLGVGWSRHCGRKMA